MRPQLFSQPVEQNKSITNSRGLSALKTSYSWSLLSTKFGEQTKVWELLARPSSSAGGDRRQAQLSCVAFHHLEDAMKLIIEVRLEGEGTDCQALPVSCTPQHGSTRLRPTTPHSKFTTPSYATVCCVEKNLLSSPARADSELPRHPSHVFTS